LASAIAAQGEVVRVTTTVAAIPVAATIVVCIVTESVRDPICLGTLGITGILGGCWLCDLLCSDLVDIPRALRVETEAVCAEVIVVDPTAVTGIPITVAVVVAIVTVAIALPGSFLASFVSGTNSRQLRVQAGTFVTKVEI